MNPDPKYLDSIAVASRAVVCVALGGRIQTASMRNLITSPTSRIERTRRTGPDLNSMATSGEVGRELAAFGRDSTRALPRYTGIKANVESMLREHWTAVEDVAKALRDDGVIAHGTVQRAIDRGQSLETARRRLDLVQASIKAEG